MGDREILRLFRMKGLPAARTSSLQNAYFCGYLYTGLLPSEVVDMFDLRAADLEIV